MNSQREVHVLFCGSMKKFKIRIEYDQLVHGNSLRHSIGKTLTFLP
jgi:hypothetical protein